LWIGVAQPFNGPNSSGMGQFQAAAVCITVPEVRAAARGAPLLQPTL